MRGSVAELRARLARTKDIEKQIDIRHALGMALFQTNLAEAEREMTAMLEECTAISHPRGIANAQFVLGRIFFRTGRHNESLEHLTGSLEFANSVDDEALKSEILIGMSDTHRELANYRGAVTCAMEAMFIQHRLGLPLRKVASLQSLAYAYLRLSDLSTALKYAQEGLTTAQSVSDKGAEAAILIALARIHSQIGNISEALQMEHASLKVHREMQKMSFIAANLGNIGLFHHRLGQYEEAESFLSQALALQQEIGHSRGEALSYLYLAEVYSDMGRLDRAEEYVLHSLSMAEAQKSKLCYCESLGILATIRAKQQDTTQAKALYLKVLDQLEGNELIEVKITTIGSLIPILEDGHETGLALQYQKMLTDARMFQKEQHNQHAIASLQVRLEVARMQREREMYKRMAEQAVKAFEDQTRELNALASEQAHRRELLQTLQEDLTKFEKENGVSAAMRSIRKKIDAEVEAEHHVSHVDEILNSIQKEFISVLAEKYPSLSKTERNICLFLKLNMRSTDIANLLFTSERTVEHHRSHIRKKMGLSASESLKEHLDALEQQVLAQSN